MQEEVMNDDERIEEISGKMWSVGRDKFFDLAARFAVAKTYDEQAMIANIAPAEIWSVMREQKLLLAIEAIGNPVQPTKETDK